MEGGPIDLGSAWIIEGAWGGYSALFGWTERRFDVGCSVVL